MLVVMAGLPGVGKSAIAHRLAERLPAICLNKDVIRAGGFAPAEIRYAKSQDDACFTAMLQATEQVLAYNPACWVILDGRTFTQGSDLIPVVQLAARLPDRLYVIACQCCDETARRRLEADPSHPAANRDFALYLHLKARQTPLPFPALPVDTDRPIDDCVNFCLNHLLLPQSDRGL